MNLETTDVSLRNVGTEGKQETEGNKTNSLKHCQKETKG